MTWFKQRFTESAARIKVCCEVCARPMWFPLSKAGLYRTCGGECRGILKKSGVIARLRHCETCEREFTPRAYQVAHGGGRYCSQKCNTAFRDAGCAPGVRERGAATWKEKAAAGLIKVKRGQENPSWKGGPEATLIRYRSKRQELTRAYRKANPEWCREQARKRSSRKIGRLPRGTVKKLGELQRWKCAACRGKLGDDYHVDHIVPLARGGKHHPLNIQLLCPRCNLTKSAKDPIKFMQEKGFLL